MFRHGINITNRSLHEHRDQKTYIFFFVTQADGTLIKIYNSPSAFLCKVLISLLTTFRSIKYIVTDSITSLPGNSSVNTVQHGKIRVDEAAFSADPTEAPIDSLDSDHVIYVYCSSMSVPRLYNERREL
jgi:hypothetical protein